MSERYLTILEVSQKQAYIFQSNKLKDNIINSAVIAWVMDAEYMERIVDDRTVFEQEKNLVYSGGGHTVLEFKTREQAVCFTKAVTKAVRNDYPGIEVFAKTIQYDTQKSPADNLKELTKALEKKKSERRAAFHQGSFGVEKIDATTLKPISDGTEKENQMPSKEEETEKKLMPQGYQGVLKFEDLGGTKNRSNFIAVVHIDGNAMGKRVEKLQQRFIDFGWEEYKKELREFSESIDNDFKDAYKEMAEYVADNIRSEKLIALNLINNNFPVRRIITAGDDICFVAEGRIGLECAAAFINKLSCKKNKVDKEGYAACAGVAIVHQKYPFYKAYELAEMLCGNAKRVGAALSSDGTGSDISMIDWHIEFGEIKDTLDEIRADYRSADGEISWRPYIVNASESIIAQDAARSYSQVRNLIEKIKGDDHCARGTLKELRSVLKKGIKETKYFIEFHKIGDLVKWDLHDDYKMLFDAIELLDTFIALEDKEGLN